MSTRVTRASQEERLTAIEESIAEASWPALRKLVLAVRQEIGSGALVAAPDDQLPDPAGAVSRAEHVWAQAVDRDLVPAVEANLGRVFAEVLGDADVVSARSWQQQFLADLPNRMRDVPNAVHDRLKTELAAGITAGDTIPQIRDRMTEVLSVDVGGEPSTWEKRAKTIARTEATATLNGGQAAAWRARDSITGESTDKFWIATIDARTRDDHFAADGQRVALEDDFIVGGFRMAHPGDPRAPAKETVNCRCTLGEVARGEELPDVGDRQLDPSDKTAQEIARRKAAGVLRDREQRSVNAGKAINTKQTGGATAHNESLDDVLQRMLGKDLEPGGDTKKARDLADKLDSSGFKTEADGLRKRAQAADELTDALDEADGRLARFNDYRDPQTRSEVETLERTLRENGHGDKADALRAQMDDQLKVIDVETDVEELLGRGSDWSDPAVQARAEELADKIDELGDLGDPDMADRLRANATEGRQVVQDLDAARSDYADTVTGDRRPDADLADRLEANGLTDQAADIRKRTALQERLDALDGADMTDPKNAADARKLADELDAQGGPSQYDAEGLRNQADAAERQLGQDAAKQDWVQVLEGDRAPDADLADRLDANGLTDEAADMRRRVDLQERLDALDGADLSDPKNAADARKLADELDAQGGPSQFDAEGLRNQADAAEKELARKSTAEDYAETVMGDRGPDADLADRLEAHGMSDQAADVRHRIELQERLDSLDGADMTDPKNAAEARRLADELDAQGGPSQFDAENLRNQADAAEDVTVRAELSRAAELEAEAAGELAEAKAIRARVAAKKAGGLIAAGGTTTTPARSSTRSAVIAAGGTMGKTWEGVLAPIGTNSGDHRRLKAGGKFSFRPLPLPLLFQETTADGHDTATVVGRILAVEVRDDLIWGSGDYLDDPAFADTVGKAQALVSAGMGHVSVDLADVVAEIVDADGNPVNEADLWSAFESGATVDVYDQFAEATVIGATQVSKPAFAEAIVHFTGEGPEDGPGLVDKLGTPIAVGSPVILGGPDESGIVIGIDSGAGTVTVRMDDGSDPWVGDPGQVTVVVPLVDAAGAEVAVGAQVTVEGGEGPVTGIVTETNQETQEVTVQPADPKAAPLVVPVAQVTVTAVAPVAPGVPQPAVGLPPADPAAPAAAAVTDATGAEIGVGDSVSVTPAAPEDGSEPVQPYTGVVTAVDEAAATVTVQPDDPAAAPAVVPAEQVTVTAKAETDEEPADPADDEVNAAMAEVLRVHAHNQLHSLRAAAGTAALWRPDAEVFADPELKELTPMTIGPDGRVFGHIAGWQTCHVGFTNQCVLPPQEASFDYFHIGEVELGDGSTLAVGNLTLGGRHADVRLAYKDAVAHYDDAGAGVAVVRAYKDEFGIAIAGTLTPETSESQKSQLRRCGLSGDWRRIGGEMRLAGALAVNTGGFPVPRYSIDGQGRQRSLVAAAMVPQRKATARSAAAVYEDIARRVFADERAKDVRRAKVRALALTASAADNRDTLAALVASASKPPVGRKTRLAELLDQVG